MVANIPASLEFTESDLPPDIMMAVQETRQVMTSYYRFRYPALIGFMVLMVLGIILISRQVKYITRSLGSTLLIYGAFEYAGVFAAKHFGGLEFARQSLPGFLQSWLPQFINDLMAPLEIFSLVLLIAGAILFVVSFVYKAPRTQPE